MSSSMTTIGEGGRIVIPAQYRKALKLKTGDKLIVLFEDGALRVLTREKAVKEAQEMYRRIVPNDRDLVAELIAERRAEAARESRE